MSDNNQPIKLTVSQVLEDLQNGYTRTKDDKNYQGDGKSIQEKYSLNKSDVSRLFQHEKLKGRKTIGVRKPSFILEDDTDQGSTTSEPEETEESAALESDTEVVEEEDSDVVEEVSADASTDSQENEDEDDPSWLSE